MLSTMLVWRTGGADATASATPATTTTAAVLDASDNCPLANPSQADMTAMARAMPAMT
jgi:hypothetical protein